MNVPQLPVQLHRLTGFLVLAALPSLLSFAYAQEFTFSMILNSDSTALGTSTINASVAAPAIEGDYIAFRSIDRVSGQVDGVWSYHIPTGTFTRLVGLGTPVPGGKGAFIDFASGGSSLGGPVLRDGIVVFGGTDEGDNPSGYAAVGIFSVPVEGGEIKKIANYETPAPDTPTNFFNFGEDSRKFGSVWHKDGVVVFEGTFGGGPIGGTGVYHAPVGGGTIEVVGDSNNPWNPEDFSPVQNFSNSATDGVGVALLGGTVFGTYGLFYSSIPSAGAETFTLLAGPDTALPEATSPPGDTLYFLPSVQMEGERIGFIARDISSDTVGVYETDNQGGSIAKIVSSKDSLESIDTFPSSSINPFSFAMDGADTLFLVYAGHDDQGLFMSTAEGILSVADTSFVLEGVPLYDFIEITPFALDNGRFVFTYSTITFPRSVLVLGATATSCPFTKAVDIEGESGEAITLAYAVRDQVLPRMAYGDWMVQAYYRHAAEVTQRLLTDRALRRQAMALFHDLTPALFNATQGEPLSLDTAARSSIKRFAGALQNGATRRLAADLQRFLDLL